MNDLTWLSDVLNKPWKAYATGPDAYDCRGVLCKAFWHIHGVVFDRHSSVPINNAHRFHEAVQQEAATGCWQRLVAPEHGCIVLLGSGLKPHHVGVWLDINGGRLLHSTEQGGVHLAGYAQLKQYYLIEYWRYVGKQTKQCAHGRDMDTLPTPVS